METRLKCKVVMLPTEKAIKGSTIQVQVSNNYLMGITTNPEYTATDLIKPEHLYFTSKRKIKEGDWFIVNLFNVENVKSTVVEQCKWIKDGIWVNGMGVVETRHIENCQKIESATDLSLNLPLIPQSFVEKYVQKQGDIDEVEIEMINENEELFNGFEWWTPKLRSDNTVIVHKVKDTWTREEVEKLCRTALSDGTLFCMPNFRGKVLTSNEWIEENL